MPNKKHKKVLYEPKKRLKIDFLKISFKFINETNSKKRKIINICRQNKKGKICNYNIIKDVEWIVPTAWHSAPSNL